MIQYGIIAKKISRYEFKVRVPRYDKIEGDPTGISTNDLATAIVSAVPGNTYAYAVGDRVIVGFENEELDNRVILGLMYTENESKSDAINEELEGGLQTLSDAIDTINAKKSYVNIKYSNDNGVAFTSLYNPSNVQQTENGVESIDKVSIDNSIDIVWSIADKDGANLKDKYQVETHIFHGDAEIYSSTEWAFEIPADVRTDGLTLSFIIKGYKTDLDNCIVSLTTDKITLGTIYGDYLGIYVSDKNVATSVPSDYTWVSFKDSIERAFNELNDSLKRRVKSLEQDVRGVDEEGEGNEGFGLLDGISILDKQTASLKKQYLRFENQYPSIILGNYTLETNKLTGHLTLKR